MSDYRYIFNSENADIEFYKDIFRGNNEPRDSDVLHWMHFDNPLKDNLICYALTGDNKAKVAALYTAFPVTFRISDQTVKGCQSIDTITDVDHRGKGLFIECAKNLYAFAEKKGYEMVYGFPNSSSAGGFFRKLGWRKVTESAPFLILPLRSKYFVDKFSPKFLKNIIPNINLKLKRKEHFENVIIVDPNSADFTGVWKDYHGGQLVGIERDDVYLRWRLNKPVENYITIGIYEDQKLQSYLTYAIKNKHDGRIAYLMEYLYRPKYKKQSAVLLQYMLNKCLTEKVDCILAWNLDHSDNHSNIKKVGFKNFPDFLRPIVLNVGVKEFTCDKDALYNFENWYISYLDSDTV